MSSFVFFKQSLMKKIEKCANESHFLSSRYQTNRENVSTDIFTLVIKLSPQYFIESNVTNIKNRGKVLFR